MPAMLTYEVIWAAPAALTAISPVLWNSFYPNPLWLGYKGLFGFHFRLKNEIQTSSKKNCNFAPL